MTVRGLVVTATDANPESLELTKRKFNKAITLIPQTGKTARRMHRHKHFAVNDIPLFRPAIEANTIKFINFRFNC